MWQGWPYRDSRCCQQKEPSEVTMNTYLADRIARDRADALAAEATRARRARAARQARRNRAAVRRVSTGDISAATTVADSTAGHRPALRIARPFAAVHAWIACGQR
jgi:hypothetical protein